MAGNLDTKIWGLGEVGLSPKHLGATRLKYALDALEKGKKGKVLEIGCGSGAFARAVKKHRPELTVIGGDINSKALRAAKKIGEGVDYRKADAHRLPFKDSSLEAIVAFDVWEHLEKPRRALREVFRVLKPGGIFHTFVPIEGERLVLHRLLPSPVFAAKRKYGGHIQAFTRKDVMRLVTSAGLEIKKADYSCYWLHQLVDLGYFNFLRLTKGAGCSVESYLAGSGKSLMSQALGPAATLFGYLTFWENKIFKFMPPAGIHLTAIKKGGSR